MTGVRQASVEACDIRGGNVAARGTRHRRAIGRIVTPVVLFPLLLIALGTSYLLTAQRLPAGQSTDPSLVGRMLRTAQPRNPRPTTLDPAKFSAPDIRLAYQVAKEIPQILEYLPCYCGCFSNSNHRNNLDCFHDEHGEECLMCRAIALEAQQLNKTGVTLTEIKKKVDQKWAPRAEPPAGR